MDVGVTGEVLLTVDVGVTGEVLLTVDAGGTREVLLTVDANVIWEVLLTVDFGFTRLFLTVGLVSLERYNKRWMLTSPERNT